MGQNRILFRLQCCLQLRSAERRYAGGAWCHLRVRPNYGVFKEFARTYYGVLRGDCQVVSRNS